MTRRRRRRSRSGRPPTDRRTLGFPGRRNRNTTRVGGADPATNAAGVALAVFPSTTAARRPAAVTLVGEDDWAGGDRRGRADGGAGAGADPHLQRRRHACPERRSPGRARPAGRRRDRRRPSLRSATSPRGTGKVTGVDAGERPPPRPRSPNCATGSPAGRRSTSSSPPKTHPSSRCRPPPGPRARATRCSSPAATTLPGPTADLPRSATRGAGLRARPPFGDLRGGRPRNRRDRRRGQPGRRRGPGRQRDRLRPLRRRRLRLEHQRPRPRVRARPRATRRWTPPPRRRSRPPEPGDRCCSPTTPVRCRRSSATTCSTSSPATPTTRPAPSTTTSG